MKFINEKKIPPRVLSVIFYLSLSFGCWYYMRQLMAYFSVAYLSAQPAILVVAGNAVVGAFLGGFVLYLIINPLINRALHPYRLFGVNNDMLRYVFKLSLSAGSLIYGGLTFIYFSTPLLALYGDYILRFIVLTVFAVIGFMYCVKNGFIPKELIGRTLYAVFFSYLITYTAVVALKLLLFYMMGVV